MYSVGSGITVMFFTMVTLIIIFVPLGLWKLIELITALIQHIHWS